MTDVRAIDDLRKQLSPPRRRHLELWASAPPDQSMSALICGEVGWLLYFRKNGDAGFSTRNPHYSGDPAAMLDYQLDNGQLDKYPASWALAISEVQRAMEHFIANAEPPAWLTWHNDSGDGVVIGRAT